MLSDTELRLSYWRDGSTKAERLAAATLALSGYEEIDPQSPLGGPDGKKDILCSKRNLIWVGAVYFPTGPKYFSAIKKKYISDLNGAPSQPKGFVFVTNQSLTPKQKETLATLATNKGKQADFLHLQQLVVLLDSAPGYGVRIQYLRIPMTIEEQLSWATESDSQTAKALSANTRELLALRASIERVGVDQSEIIRTLQQSVPLTSTSPDLISVSVFTRGDEFEVISSAMSPELILLIHRLICFDLQSSSVGAYRKLDVWIGNRDGPSSGHLQPPSAEKVEALLKNLLEEWNSKYRDLGNQNCKLTAIAKFHASFTVIHPFVDGNGRVARAILVQQCLDLFGKADMTLMNKGSEYYSALQAADAEHYEPLKSIIKPVID